MGEVSCILAACAQFLALPGVNVQPPDLVLVAMTWLSGDLPMASPDMGRVAKLVVDLYSGSLQALLTELVVPEQIECCGFQTKA